MRNCLRWDSRMGVVFFLSYHDNRWWTMDIFLIIVEDSDLFHQYELGSESVGHVYHFQLYNSLSARCIFNQSFRWESQSMLVKGVQTWHYLSSYQTHQPGWGNIFNMKIRMINWCPSTYTDIRPLWIHWIPEVFFCIITPLWLTFSSFVYYLLPLRAPKLMWCEIVSDGCPNRKRKKCKECQNGNGFGKHVQDIGVAQFHCILS